MIDVQHATFADYCRWTREQIDAAREQMETPGLDATTTEWLRGQITAHRAFIDLGRSASIEAEPEPIDSYGLSRAR